VELYLGDRFKTSDDSKALGQIDDVKEKSWK
jgi:hypothetical protein